MSSHSSSISPSRTLAYAAPVAGTWFFYIPMWNILPGLYVKYFGLSLSAMASCILVIRLFDGVIDTATGYLSVWHRAADGSRKSWTVVGGLGTILARTSPRVRGKTPLTNGSAVTVKPKYL